MPPAWTIRSLLTWMTQDFQAAGIGTPRLDAELLIAHALGCDRVRLYLELERPLGKDELTAVRALVVRRRKREPVAYILERREFFQRDFVVSPSVLVPRPDTETLVERALALLAADAPLRVLDLCTGSGAIAVTLAAERPVLRVDATDISEDALAVARDNAARHGVSERVAFFRGDLFAALPEASGSYALIAVNPPYVPTLDQPTLAPELAFEPKLALFAGTDGLLLVNRVCDEASAWLAPGASLLMEIGAGQAEAVLERIGTNSAWRDARAHRDLGGIARVIEAVRS